MSLTKCMSAVFNKHGVDTVDQEHLSELVREHLDIAGRNLEQAVTSSTGRKVLRAAVNQALADAKAERGTLLQALRDQHPDVFAQPKPAPAPAEAAAPNDAVEDTLREQITATGRYDAETAAANAAIAAATYRVLGQRLGVTPEEALQRFPLNVQGGPVGQLLQSVTLRSGKETLLKYGIRPGERISTRQLAAILERRQRELYGTIAADNRSEEAEQRIASWMVKEIKFELEQGANSGAGWYGEKYQRALDLLAQWFPTLRGNAEHRGLLTALIAITSNGQKVIANWTQAARLFKSFLDTGRVQEDFAFGGKANEAMRAAVRELNSLLGRRGGIQAALDHLLQVHTVGTLNAMAREQGLTFSSGYLVTRRMPMAALTFGPKIGAFFANLMGSHGYLTMDRWWTRTFNRYRGTLLPTVSPAGVARFREMLAQVDPTATSLTDEELLARTAAYQQSYEDKGFKHGTALEKAANTLYKDAFVALADAPQNASDREFMYRAVERAQRNLRRGGIQLSVADIQAILWYYEKRLYGQLGARASADISFEEAARQLVARGQSALDTEPVSVADEDTEDTFELRSPEGNPIDVAAPAPAARVLFEVAPDPNDTALTTEWNTLTDQQKQDVSAVVADRIIPEVLAAAGTQGNLETQYGGYQGATNPSFALMLPASADAATIVELTKLAGFVMSQDAMMTVSEKPFAGSDPVGVVTIDLPADTTLADARAIYDQLWDLEENGEKLVGGHTTVNGKMAILNYSSLSSEDLAARVDARLNNRYTIEVRQAHAWFPSKEEYDYASGQGDGTLPAGSPLRGDANRLRGEASRRIREAIADARRQGTLFQSDVRGGGDGRGVPAREVWRSVPRYAGGQAEGAVSEAAIHFSGDEREELDSAFWGRGMKDAAAQRVKDGDDARLRHRIYFYLDNGSGVKPESGVGFNAHAVTLDNLYDAVADPLGLARGRSANEFESAILDAGFDGYVSQVGSGSSARRAAVLLGERKVPVKAIGYAHEANQALAARREQGAQGDAYFAPEAMQEARDLLNAWKSRETLVYMSPDDFLALAEGLDGPAPEKAGPIAERLRAGGVFESLPFLNFSHNDDTGVATVTGHEGRHRAMALRERGVTQMPVLLRSTAGRTIRWGQQNTPNAFDRIKTWPTELVGEDGRTRRPFPVMDPLTALNQDETTPRGAYDIGTGTISLLANADRSTFVHELGHHHLEILTRLAAEPNASAAIKADVQALLDWFGVESIEAWQGMSLDAKRPYHEQFARGFEAYLAEGKAPTPQLEGIFARFKEWLLEVYQSLRDLDVELTPEVRRVFDRMLTEEKPAPQATATQQTEAAGTLEQRAPRRPADPVLTEALDLIGLGRPVTLAQRIKTYLSGGWGQIRADLASASGHLKTGVFDKFNPIKQAELRLLGNLPAEQSSYVAARFSTGLSSLLRGVLMYGAPEWRDGIAQRVAGSKGLLDILSPVAEDINDWLGWMVGMRAERLKGEGRENLLSDAHIAKLKGLAGPANGAKAQRFQQVARDFAGFKRAVLDFAQTAGLIDAATRPAWDLADWIPFYRVMEEQGGGVRGPRNAQGLGWQSSGIRQLKGGESAMNDPLANILQNFAHLLDASMKNHAVRLAVQNFDGYGVFQELKVSERMGRALVPLSEVKRLLKEAGVDTRTLPQVALEGIAKMWSFQTPEGKDVIRVMMDGKARYFHVTDPEMLRALTAVDETAFGGIFKAFRFTKRLLTGAVTADPAFIARNFIRDMLHAWTINPDGMRVGIDSVRGLTKTLTETGGAIDMAFAGASFMGGYLNANDPTEVARSIRRALRDKGLSASTIDKHLATVIDTPVKLWEMYRRLGDSVENASREAAYEAALKVGKSKAQAAFEAKDLMDYSMRGQWAAIRALTDMLPFFNARLQGLYKLGRSGALPGPSIKAKVVAKGLTITLATLALMLANKDREEYDKLEDWDKDAYWHFWVGDEHFRLPKPFEIGLLYGTVPERLFRRFWTGQDDNEKFMRRMFAGMSDTLAFDPRPQLAKPIMEVISNKNAFTGRDIENISDEGVAPSARYNEGTSETARWLGERFSDTTGVSPKQFEHLIRGYFGTIGSYVLGVSDLVVRKATGMPTAPALRPDEIPVLSAFYRGSGPARSTRHTTEFYEMLREAEQAYRTVRRWREEGLVERAEQMETEKAGLLDVRKTLNKTSDRLSKIRKQLEQVARDPDMTAREKRIQMDELIAARNELVQEAMRVAGGAR